MVARGARVFLIVALLLGGCLTPQHRADPPGADRNLIAALLLSVPFQSIAVEVDYVSGYGPYPDVLERALDKFASATGKPVRLVSVDEINGTPDTNREWDRDSMLSAHETSLDHPLDANGFGIGQTVVVHVLFLDGNYPGARGKAMGNVVGIWKDSYGPGGYQLPKTEHEGLRVIEEFVLVHELGHVIGLVNCGLPMMTPRESAAGECHSDQGDSVMREGFDYLQLAAVLAGDETAIPRNFNAADIRDIESFKQAKGTSTR